MALPLHRLRHKQSVPGRALPLAEGPAVAAIGDEAWSELVALSTDAKRKHIHWTHVRTHDPGMCSPET